MLPFFVWAWSVGRGRESHVAVLGRPCCVVMSRRDEHTIQWRKAEHAKKRKNARAPRLVPDAWPRTDAWRLRGATMVGGEGGRGGLLGITMLRQASLCSVRHHYAPSGITVLLFFFFFSQMCHSTHHSWPARFSFDSRVAPSAAVCMRSTWRTSAPAASGSARATMLRLRRRVRMLLLRTIRRVTMTTLMMTLMMTLRYCFFFNSPTHTPFPHMPHPVFPHMSEMNSLFACFV